MSSEEVSSLPLNERDFSKLLLLAAGTMTDTNGAANFTQQFAVNGQRGVAAVFALDGADTTDPELGGATFANFNVDAIQEVQMVTNTINPEFGRNSGAIMNALTKSGTNSFHGSAFWFYRDTFLNTANFFQVNRDPTQLLRIGIPGYAEMSGLHLKPWGLCKRRRNFNPYGIVLRQES